MVLLCTTVQGTQRLALGGLCRLGRFRRCPRLHERGVIEDRLLGIGHRERGNRIVEGLALAGVAGDGRRVARSRVRARKRTAA